MNTQSAKLLVLLWELAHLDDSNDMLQSICEFQVAFLFIEALFILIRSKWKLTWDSHIVCGVSLESSQWHHTPSRAKTFAGWVRHSSHIGDLFLKYKILHFFSAWAQVKAKSCMFLKVCTNTRFYFFFCSRHWMQGCLMVLSIRDQLAMLQMEFRETCLLEKMWIMLKRGLGELSTNTEA